MNSILNDRNRNLIDGTYANVPDPHIVQPSKNIGLRKFNNSVLIHNWYEERSGFGKKKYENSTTYKLDYKTYPDAKPDILLRRKLIGSSDGIGSRNLIGMHNCDSSKNFITMYDETINRRQRPPPEIPFGQQFPEKRQWKIIKDSWVPEKSDHPLQDSPTTWGLLESKKNEKIRYEDKYKSQLPNLSEYNDRFQRHSAENYLKRSLLSVPKNLSTSFFEINKTLNNQLDTRSTTGRLRQPQTGDVMNSVYNEMFIKSTKAPRTLYYLGKIPTNGALDVYSMKDFETLTPANIDVKQNLINEDLITDKK